MRIPLEAILDSGDASLFDVRSTAPGRKDRSPSPRRCCSRGLRATCSDGRRTRAWAGTRAELGGPEILILSTHGGIRDADGTPVALGYHTGHWEVGLLMEAAAKELKSLRRRALRGLLHRSLRRPHPGHTGMFDSLPYRNDAATVFRRLIRSLPTRRGVIGVATCDKGLPAMMIALAAMHDLPCVLVPGGVTLLAEEGEDAGLVQIGGRALRARPDHARSRRGESLPRLRHARAAAASFWARRPRRRWWAKRSGMSLTHSALAPSGQPIWLDMARRSARAVLALEARGIRMRDILTEPPCTTPWCCTRPSADPPT